MKAGALLAVWLLSACELWGADLGDARCRELPIDRGAELLLTGPELQSLARNRDHGPLSFRARLDALAPPGTETDSDRLWQRLSLVAPAPEASPFRFVAVVNRTDLAEQLAPESPAGEARIVYTLTNGPGDDATAAALPVRLILEYSLGRREGVRIWAQRFHALASAGNAHERAAALSRLLELFAGPAEQGDGPVLSQLRLSDARSGPARLYEFALTDGRLVERGLRNTPRLDLAGSAPLSEFVRVQADAIRQGVHRVPEPWLASSAQVSDHGWQTNAEPELERAFTRGTCPGCHSELGPARSGFHLAEGPTGEVLLSPFLLDEELPRREAVMRARLCPEP